MKGQKIMHIELKYFNPNTERFSHFFFSEIESELALGYLVDVKKCGYFILI